MKICIVTLYKTINSGSFLQAFALGKYLEKQGHDVYFYDVKYLKRLILYKYMNIPIYFLRYGLDVALKYIDALIEFHNDKKVFSIAKRTKLQGFDCFVLGSDTIWNLDSQNLTQNIPTYWGLNFDGRIITYAGSVANTPIEKFNNHPELYKAVSRWSSISVRDTYTMDILSQMTEKDISLVCDPTFLLDVSDYMQTTRPINNQKKCIFLYLFTKLSTSQFQKLTEFAKENDLEIIQGTYVKKDKNVTRIVSNSPFSFLSHMFSAQYIITDTFHGTAFSINFRKNFIVINRDKRKVSDLLKLLKMENRLVNDDSFLELLENPINYDECDQILKSLREKSCDYIRESLIKPLDVNKGDLS